MPESRSTVTHLLRRLHRPLSLTRHARELPSTALPHLFPALDNDERADQPTAFPSRLPSPNGTPSTHDTQRH